MSEKSQRLSPIDDESMSKIERGNLPAQTHTDSCVDITELLLLSAYHPIILSLVFSCNSMFVDKSLVFSITIGGQFREKKFIEFSL
jgi:hypothetical protein